MPSNSIDRLLRALYRRDDADATSRESPRAATTQRAMDAYLRRYPEERRGGFSSGSLMRQVALAAAVLLVLMIGACQVPVAVQLNLGQRMHFVVPATPEIKARVDGLVDTVRGLSRVDKVEVRVRHEGGETMRVTLGVWGEDLDPQAVYEGVVAAYPELEILDRESAPLEATVHTTLGDKLRHDLFQRALDEQSVEEARAAILEQLAADGFQGEAEVVVEEQEEGKRRVEIKLRSPGAEDVAEVELETEDELELVGGSGEPGDDDLVEEVVEEVVHERGGAVEREVRVIRRARRDGE